MRQSEVKQLERYFGLRSVQRGQALFKAGAVVRFKFYQSTNQLKAHVQGTQATPYAVTVMLDEHDEPFECLCSCPVGFNCKHAVATLVTHRSRTRRVPTLTELALTELALTELEPGRKTAPDASNYSSEIEARLWWEQWHSTQEETKHVPFSRNAWDRPRARIYSLKPLKQSGNWSFGVSLTLLDAPRTATGQFNKGRRADTDHTYTDYTLHLTSMDKDIHALGSARLQADQGRYTRDMARYELTGHFGQVLLELTIKTGRCFLETDRHQPLVMGVSRTLSVDWHQTSDGDHRLVPALTGLEHCWVVDAEQPWWIDPISVTAGPIDTQLTGAQLALLLEAPAMQDAQLQELSEWQMNAQANAQITAETDEPINMQSRVGRNTNVALLLPSPPIEPRRLISVPPSPVLLLHSPSNDPHVDSWEIALMMRYDSALVPCEIAVGTAITPTVDEQGNSVRIRRHYELETFLFHEAMERARGMLPHWHTESDQLLPIFLANADTPAARFSTYARLVKNRDELERDNWELVVLPPVHVDPLRPSSFQGLVERAADGSPGWFDLSLDIELDGERYDLMQLVATYIERGGGDEPLFAETTHGRFMQIEASLVRPVAEVLHELGASANQDGKVRLSRTRALALQNLDEAISDEGFNTIWRGTSDPFKFAKRLQELGNVDTKTFDQTALPRGLKATLRPYQRAGLGWLNALASNNVCGILADDMGLGKTLQALAHILWLRQSRRLKGPVLIVVPTSLLLNWAREAMKFTPRLKVRIWHGQERHENPLDEIDPPAHLIITSYGLALRDNELLANHGFDMLVLDEAQQIRNPLAKTTRAIKSLPIERRLCLSGTPLENHLGELWSQFDFLMPDLLGDAVRFNKHYRIPIEKHGDTQRQQRLATAVKPFLLRRRKEDVASDLPPKTEMLREVHLGTAQAKLYESIRASMQKRVRKALQSKGLAQSHVTVLDALLKLRQCCCHPELVKLDSAKRVADSAKTTLVLDMIDELIAEGRRILVFSSFTSMLDILERELKARDHHWVKLTGRTRKRDAVIDAFQRGNVPLFLISLKAGGTGLNLTAADTVIHYDPWWNPAAEAQASARAHRIGQNKPVFVYKLVAADTVEQRIVLMQQRKQELADAMIESGEGASLTSLSVEETLALFDPD